MLPPTSNENQGGMFATWGMIEWIISSLVGATWVAGIAVAGFVLKLSGRIDAFGGRIELLEKEAELREKTDDMRHGENVHIMRQLQQQLTGIVLRTDEIYKELARRRGHD